MTRLGRHSIAAPAALLATLLVVSAATGPAATASFSVSTKAASTALPTAAAAVVAVRHHPSPHRPGSYRNPLAPRIPGAARGSTVDSCADPAVIRGVGRNRAWWFMYCTTDPLNDTDLAGSGAGAKSLRPGATPPRSEADDRDPVALRAEQPQLNFHPLPMMRSKNLVDWTYVGDALPHAPAWAADGAGLWAPDVVHSRVTGLYYLTFVVTDTDDSLRGPGACTSTSDSAIGVATSRNPTGPWTVSDRPLVGPRPDPAGTCAFLWTYDPDVLGNDVGRSSVLYFGSYNGGVHATRIAFDAHGARTVGARTRIAIGNRYEGTNVVKRGGWYWLFGSATNCCNGPLTSYGVFAARSRSPWGPFRDRQGHSILAGRVGGTPVLQPNGNRWVGVGHSSAFRDAAGRWWTVYHAVDRTDPYFAPDPGFTKRPAMLDPLDWVGGWPQVRAGRWASETKMPAPASTKRRPSRYHPHPVVPLRTGRELAAYSDDFAHGLGPAWTWRREPAPQSWGVEHGALRFETQAADLHVDTNTASVLSRPAPRGDYVVQTDVRLNLPPEGCCHDYVQAGLVLTSGGTRADDTFVKLVHVSIAETRQTEWAKEVPTAPADYPRYGNGVVGAPGDVTRLRIVVQKHRGADRYTAYTGEPGHPLVRGGTWTHDLGDAPRIGLVSMGGAGFTARFRDVQVWRLRH
jgi:arabinan endo-1,5-alpha-L-arabinosidase